MNNNAFTQEYKDTYNQYIKIVELFQKDFHFYIDTHSIILEKIFKNPKISLENFFQKLQERIFQKEFCKESFLEKKKNNFLKIYFETEKIRQTNHQIDLFKDELDICQRASKIVQRHWEFFQYKKEQITFSELLSLFFGEVEEVLFLWEILNSKLEIFSKVFILDEKKLPKESTTEKILQIFFLKQDSRSTDLESVENFIILLKRIFELLLKTQLISIEDSLKVLDIQIQKRQVTIKLLLPTSLFVPFQKIITNIHIDKLQKDGLQKILVDVLDAETIRNMEKKIITHYQRYFKEATNSIKKIGSFLVVTKEKKEVTTKVISLLEKMEHAKIDGNTHIRNSRKNTRECLLSLKETITSGDTKTISTDTNKIQNNAEHIAYLTS